MEQDQVTGKFSNFNLYVATCAANLITISAGTTITWTSPTLPKMKAPNSPIPITDEEGAWIGSFLPLGASFGPLIASLIVDKIGKKFASLLCASIILVSWMLVAAAFDALEALYVARFLTGISVGAVFSIIPLYVAEISSTETRGITGGSFILFVYTGCNISYLFGPYTSILTLIWINMSVPLIAIAIFLWIPETPFYLLKRGDKRKAYAALQWLRGQPGDSVVQKELDELQELLDKSAKETAAAGTSTLQIFESRNLKCLYYVCTLMLIQQLAGINAINFYSEAIFQKATSAISSSISAIICGLVMFGTGIFVPSFSKLFRIKNVLWVSSTGCAFFLVLLALYFYAQNHDMTAECLAWVPIMSIIGYIISHSSGLGSYAWVIAAEIFHPNVKSLGSAMATSFCWFLCFLVTRFFSTIVTLFGESGTFGLFSVVAVFGAFFCAFQLPDTQGKTVQQIQDLLDGKKQGKGELRRLSS